MPSISAGQLNYSLVRRGRSTAAETPVKLTIAGFALLPEHAGAVNMFLAVLGELAQRRAAAAYDPRQVIEVSVSGAALIRDLGLQDEPMVRLLPDILGGEPSTWHGGDNLDGNEWKPKASTFVRRFADVNDVGDYFRRLRAWIEPDNPPSQPVVVSPLGLAAALDYLDVVWRLTFGAGLLVVPSVERAARLVFDVATAEEFDNRLSAVGELFKGLDVPGDERQGTLRRLRAFLGDRLTTEAMARVDPALATLQSVTHIRNGGQHMDAATDAATALPSLGLTYPISDFSYAWQIVQMHVVQAIDAIREEVRATIPSAGARPSREQRGRRRP